MNVTQKMNSSNSGKCVSAQNAGQLMFEWGIVKGQRACGSTGDEQLSPERGISKVKKNHMKQRFWSSSKDGG